MSEQIQANGNTNDAVDIENRLKYVIENVKNNPSISSEDLLSSNKMQSSEYPDRPGIRVDVEMPLELSISPRTEVTQELSALLALGEKASIGIVTARDDRGNIVSYASVVGAEVNGERAKMIGVLNPGEKLMIGRDMLRSVVGRDDLFSGVSGTHCSIELTDGILTVIDEHSTNGTTVMTNKDESAGHFLPDISMWSQESVETQRLFKHDTKASLGRFAASH